MSMKATLQKIVSLQELGERIRRCEQQKQRLAGDVEKEDRRRSALEQELRDVGSRLIEGQKAADAYDLKISTAEQENKRMEVELNTTRHQREYDAIRQVIASHEADIQKWEDEELAALEAVDVLRRKRDEVRRQIEQQKQLLHEVSRRAAEEQRKCDRELAELRAQSDAQRKQIDATVLAAYERIAPSRAGQGLAEVRDRVCQGCYTTITKQMENLLMGDEELIYCPSCGRILMLAD